MSVATIGVVLAPSLALAAVLVQPPLPVSGGAGLTGTGVINIIQTVVQDLMIVSVVIGVGLFVYGAILYFFASKEEDGKKQMTRAVIGIALILAIGLILNTIAGLISRGGAIG